MNDYGLRKVVRAHAEADLRWLSPFPLQVQDYVEGFSWIKRAPVAQVDIEGAVGALAIALSSEVPVKSWESSDTALVEQDTSMPPYTVQTESLAAGMPCWVFSRDSIVGAKLVHESSRIRSVSAVQGDSSSVRVVFSGPISRRAGASLQVASLRLRVVGQSGALGYWTAPAPTRTRERNESIPYSISWTPYGETSPTRIDRGTIAVVEAPFETGLGPAELLALYPELANVRAPGAIALDGAISRTHRELAMRIRADLRDASGGVQLWEDDVEGENFVGVHAMLAYADAIESVAPDRAAAQRERALDLYRPAFASAWIDVARSGIPNDSAQPNVLTAQTSANLAPHRLHTSGPPGSWAGGWRR